MDFNYQALDFTVKALFVFNPNAKPTIPKPLESDMQAAKILYYYPQVQSEERNNQVGLAEGIFQFMNTFTPDEPTILPKFQTIHLVSQLFIIGQYSEDIYIFMAVTKNKVEPLNETYYEQLSKATISAVLNNYYNHFNIWFDGFEQEKEALEKQLAIFTPLWFTCFNMNFAYFQVSQFRYAPLDGPLFLTLQYLTSILFQLDSSMQEIVIFYNGYFIYSSFAHKVAVYFKQHYYDSGALWGLNEQKINQKFRQGVSGSNAFMVFNNLKNMATGAQQVRLPKAGEEQQFQKYDYFSYYERNLLVLMFYSQMESPQWKRLKEVSTALGRNTEKITQKLDVFIDANNLKSEQLRYILQYNVEVHLLQRDEFGLQDAEQHADKQDRE